MKYTKGIDTEIVYTIVMKIQMRVICRNMKECIFACCLSNMKGRKLILCTTGIETLPKYRYPVHHAYFKHANYIVELESEYLYVEDQ